MWMKGRQIYSYIFDFNTATRDCNRRGRPQEDFPFRTLAEMGGNPERPA
jgi:hypothetical protein